MNFDDSPAEAQFRSEARAWLDANGPVELLSTLNNPTRSGWARSGRAGRSR